MKEKSYKIWVSYHRDELVTRHNLREDEHHALFATHRDIEGVNINKLNPVYSEMVAMYYVWKNAKKSDYVGFEHYRRHLNVGRLPEKGECQVFRIVDFGSQTIYEQYARWHNANDMDVVLSILDEKYGKDNKYSRHILTDSRLVANCTFLMKWGDFVNLCKFLFPILETFGKKMFEGYADMSDDDKLAKWREKGAMDFGTDRTNYQTRVVSFLAERLISAWITTNLVPWNGIDVAMVTYNTTELTSATLLSLDKTTPGCHVLLFDNGDAEPFTAAPKNVRRYDNTKGKLLKFDTLLAKYPDKSDADITKSNFGSAKHTASIDKLMDLHPYPFILIDSDVLFKKSIRDFWNTGMGIVGRAEPKRNVLRLLPFLCFLNVPVLKEAGIRYFNGEKMWALSKREPDCNYDTGAWVLEASRNAGIPMKEIDIWEYIHHMYHGSWRGEENRVKEWLDKYEDLWK